MKQETRGEIEGYLKKMMCQCKRRAWDPDKVHIPKCKEFLESESFEHIADMFCGLIDDRESLRAEYDGDDTGPVAVPVDYSTMLNISPDHSTDYSLRVQDESDKYNHDKSEYNVIFELLVAASGGRSYSGFDHYRFNDNDPVSEDVAQGHPEIITWSQEDFAIICGRKHSAPDQTVAHIVFPSKRRARAFMRLVVLFITMLRMQYYLGYFRGQSALWSMAAGETSVAAMDDAKKSMFDDQAENMKNHYKQVAVAHYQLKKEIKDKSEKEIDAAGFFEETKG